MNLLHTFLLGCFLLSALAEFHENQYILDYIRNESYPLIVYNNITTSDGYILTLFRIVRDPTNFKSVVFLMHGLFASGECWFMNKPKNTLPFLLADDGHDVWIGNGRGTYHSMKHVNISLDPDNPKSPYWDFSFHETAVYDQPAMIDFILNVTNCKKVVFVGHSQGTTTFFAMASELPQYTREKVKVHIALGTSVYFDFAKGLVKTFARLLHRFFPGRVETLGGVFPLINRLFVGVCNSELSWTCLLFLHMNAGFDPYQLDMDLLFNILRQFPGPASMKGAFHYIQIIDSGNFSQYDYELEENMLQYGAPEPPLYNLSAIDTKVLLYYSDNDYLAAVEDVEKVHNSLPNSEMVYINYSAFTHVDYLIAKDVEKILHDSLRKRIASVNDCC